MVKRIIHSHNYQRSGIILFCIVLVIFILLGFHLLTPSIATVPQPVTKIALPTKINPKQTDYLVNNPSQYLDQTVMLNEGEQITNSLNSTDTYSYTFNTDSKYSGCILDIKKKDQNYVIFNIVCGTGNTYLAKKTPQNKWEVITGMGQELPYCNDMDKMMIPDDWYKGCITTDAEGNTTVRKGSLQLN